MVAKLLQLRFFLLDVDERLSQFEVVAGLVDKRLVVHRQLVCIEFDVCKKQICIEALHRTVVLKFTCTAVVIP
eukprot:SAG31_NODE_4608_length_3098_cov_3.502167_5_plen_73_part_00